MAAAESNDNSRAGMKPSQADRPFLAACLNLFRLFLFTIELQLHYLRWLREFLTDIQQK